MQSEHKPQRTDCKVSTKHRELMRKARTEVMRKLSAKHTELALKVRTKHTELTWCNCQNERKAGMGVVVGWVVGQEVIVELIY